MQRYKTTRQNSGDETTRRFDGGQPGSFRGAFGGIFMSTFGRTEQELILGCCLGALSSSQMREAHTLIERDPQAAQASGRIAAALAPLTYGCCDCPGELASRTVERLCAAAVRIRGSRVSSARVVQLGWPQNLSNVAAVVTVAACILLILGTVVPSFNFMRHRHYRQVCLDQLSGIFKSIELYGSDHDDMLPAVARSAGASWHGIGSQEPGGYSNTRNLYLLLKLGYSKRLADFICCGGTTDRGARWDASQASAYDDFPSRRDITYSYHLVSDPRTKRFALASKPLMADMNPHFEVLSPDMEICPAENSLRLNSINHARQGQNVLYGGGHALFSRVRIMGDRGDDIYTIKNVSTYRGHEWPAGPDDTFVAP